MDKRINWLQCRISQEKLCHYWKPGPTNLGDYSTKNHAAIHHSTLIPTYLTPKKYLDLLRKINQVFGAAAAQKPFVFVTEKSSARVCQKWQLGLAAYCDCGPICRFQVTIFGVWQYLHVEAIQSMIVREQPQPRAAPLT